MCGTCTSTSIKYNNNNNNDTDDTISWRTQTTTPSQHASLCHRHHIHVCRVPSHILLFRFYFSSLSFRRCFYSGGRCCVVRRCVLNVRSNHKTSQQNICVRHTIINKWYRPPSHKIRIKIHIHIHAVVHPALYGIAPHLHLSHSLACSPLLSLSPPLALSLSTHHIYSAISAMYLYL